MNPANHRLWADEKNHSRPEECTTCPAIQFLLDLQHVSFPCSVGLSFWFVTALLAICLYPIEGGNFSVPPPPGTRTESRPQTNSYAIGMACGFLPGVKELNVHQHLVKRMKIVWSHTSTRRPRITVGCRSRFCCLYTLQSHPHEVLGCAVQSKADTAVTALSALVLGPVLINMHVFIVVVTVGKSIDRNLIYFVFRSKFRYLSRHLAKRQVFC